MVEMEEITSISFDDESAITASNGIWLFNRNVVQADEGCMSGRCGFFSSTSESKLELAYFSNAFDQYKTFTARLFYKRSSAASGSGALMTNADCDIAGSIGAVSLDGSAMGYLTNSNVYSAVLAPAVRIPPVSCVKYHSRIGI